MNKLIMLFSSEFVPKYDVLSNMHDSTPLLLDEPFFMRVDRISSYDIFLPLSLLLRGKPCFAIYLHAKIVVKFRSMLPCNLLFFITSFCFSGYAFVLFTSLY